MGKIKFEKDNILPKKMIIAVWDSKSNSAVYTIWLGPGAIIGVGDRKSGVHAVPSKWPNVLFLEQTAPPSTSQLARKPANLRGARVEFQEMGDRLATLLECYLNFPSA